MPKLKPRVLRWRASESAQVAFYKLYWSREGEVDYDSDHAAVGNVTEVLLPDGVAAFTPGDGPVEFGLTAVDELGNESDMVRLKAPYQFSVPRPPAEFRIASPDSGAAGEQTPFVASSGVPLRVRMPKRALG
jgi:hypothetical protein